MVKRILCILLIAALLSLTLTSCKDEGSDTPSESEEDGKKDGTTDLPIDEFD